MALSWAVLGRRGGPVAALTILTGALLPDLFLPWRGAPLLALAMNSFIVWGAVLATGIATQTRLVTLLAASALLHLAFDFPFHASDARAHFWPVSGWTFHSPLSFWNVDHHGRILGVLEGVAALIALLVIWRRSRKLWSRALVALLAIAHASAFLHYAGHAFADAHWALW